MRKHWLFVLVIFIFILIGMYLFEGMAIYGLLVFSVFVFIYLIKFKFDWMGQINELEKKTNKALIHKRQNSEAYTQFTSIFQLRSILPFTGGWAASSDFLHLIVHNDFNKKPKELIECGSGLSTLFTAYALQKNRTRPEQQEMFCIWKQFQGKIGNLNTCHWKKEHSLAQN